MRSLHIRTERWPLAGTFTISRGSRTEAVVVVAEIEQDGQTGRGECTPYPRYGESVEGVETAIRAQARAIAEGAGREALARLMPAGAARNALDCALWDLEAKLAGRRVHDLAGLAPLRPVTTCYTLSLGTPETMAKAAGQAAHRPLLKVKLGGAGDLERIEAVRAAAPDATLVVDANEAWDEADLERNLAACAAAGIAMVEQPLPADRDEALGRIARPVPVCADESAHDRAGLDRVAGRYDAINIKLDKTGGLTEALALAAEAEKRGLEIMVGCMLGTSLAMAPALLVAQRARVVDLDAPLLLAKDRVPGLHYEGSLVSPAEAAFWG